MQLLLHRQTVNMKQNLSQSNPRELLSTLWHTTLASVISQSLLHTSVQPLSLQTWTAPLRLLPRGKIRTVSLLESQGSVEKIEQFLAISSHFLTI